MKKKQLGLLIKTLQKIEVGTGTFAESCNANMRMMLESIVFTKLFVLSCNLINIAKNN